MVSSVLGRSVVRRRLPQNASSVHSRSIVPGVTVRTGTTPPNVNAYCSRSGRNSTISMASLSLVRAVPPVCRDRKPDRKQAPEPRGSASSGDVDRDGVPAGGAGGARLGLDGGLHGAAVVGRADLEGVRAPRGLPGVAPLTPGVRGVLGGDAGRAPRAVVDAQFDRGDAAGGGPGDDGDGDRPRRD